MHAANKGNLEVVKMLLADTIDINIPNKVRK
jgi:hypothetical protein